MVDKDAGALTGAETGWHAVDLGVCTGAEGADAGACGHPVADAGTDRESLFTLSGAEQGAGFTDALPVEACACRNACLPCAAGYLDRLIGFRSTAMPGTAEPTTFAFNLWSGAC